MSKKWLQRASSAKGKRTTKADDRCLAEASGGALVCLLERGHEGAHSSTSGRPRDAAQHATWTVALDGRIAVTTYARGKKVGEWVERATQAGPPRVEPVAQPARCTDRAGGHGMQCTRDAGHVGMHTNGRATWKSKKTTGSEERPKFESPEAERSSSWWEEWERIGKPEIDVRTVPCPTCKAKSGYCKRPSGHKAMSAHAARWDEALAVAVRAYEERHREPAAADELFNADNASRWWWGWRGQLGPIMARKYTGDMAPVLDARAHPIIGRTVVGPFLLAVGEGEEHAERRIRDVLAKLDAKNDPDVVDDDPPECGDPHGPRSAPCVLDAGHKTAHCDGVAVWGEGEAPRVTESSHWRRRAHQPLTLEDEPEDPEADAAAIAAMDAAGVDEIDDDPHEDEIRSDEERALARRLREDREAHMREIEEADRDTKPPNMIEPTGETITCRGREYTVHPAARLFPTPESQYREIVASIRRDGLKHEVELLDEPGNPVIDGCSRLRACAELGIEPRTKLVRVDDPIRYVIAVNLARRHLNESQRAMAAADLATIEHGANQHTRSGKFAGPQLTQAQAAELLHVSERSVRDAARVKNSAAPEVVATVREGKLKVSAGAELAKLPKAKQREIVEKVTKGSAEVRPGKVRALVKQEQKRETVAKINTGRVVPMPVGRFGVIYGDYPWKYDNSDQHEGSRGHMGYPPMTMDEILAHAREAAKRAAADAIIALWVTNLYIPQIGRVLEAYGAEHRTMWTWVKNKAGVGTWSRGQTEHLVIASIGEPVHTLNEVSTVLHAAVREHSRKPDEAAELLAKHCAGPFLELFAREPREGWTTWGAEVDKFATEAA